jgi:hypothetical protein
METPSLIDGVQSTDSSRVTDETWRTLHLDYSRSRAAASQGSDAIAASQVMTLEYVAANV